MRMGYRISLRLIAVTLIELAITVISLLSAFLLRFDLEIVPSFYNQLELSILVFSASKLFFCLVFGVHRYSFRFIAIQDISKLIQMQLCSCISSFFLILVGTSGFPRSIHVINLLLCVSFAVAIRAGSLFVRERRSRAANRGIAKKAVIYGAGSAGVGLLREICNNASLPFSVVGFIDDEDLDQGLVVHGRRVLGRGSDLEKLVTKHGIEMALIAIPSATNQQRLRVIENCHEAGIRCLIIPGMGEIIEGKGLARQLRDVAVEDLLGRSPVNLEQARILAKHSGKTVLVTGAAGSIGSELCRQIARFQPARIIGFDIAESPLFELQQEMLRLHCDVQFIAEIGTIRSEQRLAEVFAQHRPSIVYHSAAYKHVPLMEAHVFEAVENNVFGTLNVSLAAGRHGVEDFVMISSDKAVRPTNIMGATKRMAELIVRSISMGRTKFVSVRFGNVLGSNGSVIPIFKAQIARGGPITITHPEMKRYFMTIPEASQLVLQAATMGQGGEIFVLDMGEPVRILDLARNLIRLSGLKPDQDIRIEYSGTRPGEKLFEELLGNAENVLSTHHEKIKIFSGERQDWSTTERQLHQVQLHCAHRQLDQLILSMKDCVPEYSPSRILLGKALSRQESDFSLVDRQVTSIH